MTVEEKTKTILRDFRAEIGLDECWNRLECEIIRPAIEEEREICAKILDGEAEYYRSIVEGAVVMMESRAYHRIAAKVTAHLARKVRARSDVKS